MDKQNIRLYIANLGAYNEGRLVGKWYDLEDFAGDVDGLTRAIQLEVLGWTEDADGELIPNQYEEYAIHDHEAPFRVSEYESLEALLHFQELEDYDQAKATFLYDNGNYQQLQDAIDNVDDCDYYPEMTLKELAEQFVDEGLFGEIPKAIENYLDYDAIARDLGYDYTEVRDGAFPGCYRCD